MSLKTIVTAEDLDNKVHIFIQCNSPKDAFNMAGQLHNLGEHRYSQIRLRSSKPDLRVYRWISLLLIGA